MTSIRPPAAAGSLYPSDPSALRKEVRRHLATAAVARQRAGASAAVPAALVGPHGGYVFAGPILGTAYATLAGSPDAVRRVVLVGPTHQVDVEGIVVPRVEAFATPLGDVPVDREGVGRALTVPEVAPNDRAHAPEHTLEAHLPFLQVVLPRFTLVPLLVGFTSGAAVAAALEAVWDTPGTLVVVSTDLSHHHSYYEARKRDGQTAEAIESLTGSSVGPGDACGFLPLRGLLAQARQRGLRARTLDLRSSGDTTGAKERVVGYGAFAFASLDA